MPSWPFVDPVINISSWGQSLIVEINNTGWIQSYIAPKKLASITE